jgi:hypothetical protein
MKKTQIRELLAKYWEAKLEYIRSDVPSACSQAELRMNRVLEGLYEVGAFKLFNRLFRKRTIPTVEELDRAEKDGGSDDGSNSGIDESRGVR